MKKISFLVMVIFVWIFLFLGAAKAQDLFDKNLSYGMRKDAAVAVLQKFLADNGLYAGPVNGNFYNMTRAAVQKFQNREGIKPVSGYFGPLTRVRANQMSQTYLQATVGTAPVPSASPTPVATSIPNPRFVPALTPTLTPEPVAGQYDAFAKCLTAKGVKLFGAAWCPHCQNQKKMFGESFKYVDYVECAVPTGQAQACTDNKIRAYPTWDFSGKKVEGELSFQDISQNSGCQL